MTARDMKIRKQIRVFDIYAYEVDGINVPIRYVRDYKIDKHANVLEVTFYDYSQYEYDIGSYEEKVKAIKKINKQIKQFSKKFYEVQYV